MTFEEVWDVLQLGYVVFPVPAVLHQQRKHVVEFAARMRGVELHELFEDGTPEKKDN